MNPETEKCVIMLSDALRMNKISKEATIAGLLRVLVLQANAQNYDGTMFEALLMKLRKDFGEVLESN